MNALSFKKFTFCRVLPMSDCQSSSSCYDVSTQFSRHYLFSVIRDKVRETLTKRPGLVGDASSVNVSDSSGTESGSTQEHSEFVKAISRMYIDNFSKIMATATCVSRAQNESLEEGSELKPSSIPIYEDCNAGLQIHCVGRNGKLCGVLKRISTEVSDRLNADAEYYGNTNSVFSSNFIEKVTQCLLCTPKDAQTLSHDGELSALMSKVPRLPDFAQELGLGHRNASPAEPAGKYDAGYLINLTSAYVTQHDSIVKRFGKMFLKDEEAIKNLADAVEYLKTKLT
ncbi:hypothetical protein QFC22_004589 [Naganishia vaughanmartiniae]|uniref:Uncharacterized protein n=1 Tax=Naganishia vaughanmartiniae TaxID=1424756 RepID=A0ACC2WZW6_9TREE|nr:hypothetical protein QFC22_004589 [Naganishia vaughanmartiniae]